ncbi:hypothetical protein HRbin12_01798 [bacterium HR12]|nr:hypothetical protein HRbin12_01798 [bacterium HR12]
METEIRAPSRVVRRVPARTAVQDVVAIERGPPVEPVLASPPEERVVPGAPTEDVGSVAPLQEVVPLLPVEVARSVPGSSEIAAAAERRLVVAGPEPKLQPLDALEPRHVGRARAEQVRGVGADDDDLGLLGAHDGEDVGVARERQGDGDGGPVRLPEAAVRELDGQTSLGAERDGGHGLHRRPLARAGERLVIREDQAVRIARHREVRRGLERELAVLQGARGLGTGDALEVDEGAEGEDQRAEDPEAGGRPRATRHPQVVLTTTASMTARSP